MSTKGEEKLNSNDEPAERNCAPSGQSILATIGRLVCLAFICYNAYEYRLEAVREYGRVIHEFDPWFNFRATEYLVDNGWEKFSTWFDYEAWYPIGRPVGTTIYPGLQLTSAFIFRMCNKYVFEISINDVCVFVPAVFSIITVCFMYLFTREISKNSNAALAAAGIMAIIPSHMMRSVAGGYDNESIAVAAIVGTFYFWNRSLRNDNSWWIGAIAGLSYIYMVAAWGGYTFVLNMVGVHASVLVAMGYFSPKLHQSYSLFYFIGTLGAIQFPVVGLAPLKSLEQLGPMGVFFGMHVLRYCRTLRTRDMSREDFRILQVKVCAIAVAVFAVLAAVAMPVGYLGPLSSRIRGLFVRHTRTGNPLVDSVAEHQATKPEMYWDYFHMVYYIAPFGLCITLWKRTEAKIFLIAYTLITYYFSAKMVRLVLLLAPAASACAGIACAEGLKWAIDQRNAGKEEDLEELEKPEMGDNDVVKKLKVKGKKAKKVKGKKALTLAESFTHMQYSWDVEYRKRISTRQICAVLIAVIAFFGSFYFINHCSSMAIRLSNPSIMVKGKNRNGEPMMIDDFRESYWWLRDNTPENSRVLSWWDYGYQINGVANRTTIADGNTWNHEHIALLGKILVSPEKKAHRIARHIADYVLIWSTRFGGMWGDDLNKSPHMARIGGSVYKDIDNSKFYLDQNQNPSPMMRRSLLYNLHGYRLNPDIPKPQRFEEVYTSKNKMVRIWKIKNVSEKSREWIAKHHTYPPAIQDIVNQKEDFAQLEDFNKK